MKNWQKISDQLNYYDRWNQHKNYNKNTKIGNSPIAAQQFLKNITIFMEQREDNKKSLIGTRGGIFTAATTVTVGTSNSPLKKSMQTKNNNYSVNKNRHIAKNQEQSQQLSSIHLKDQSPHKKLLTKSCSRPANLIKINNIKHNHIHNNTTSPNINTLSLNHNNIDNNMIKTPPIEQLKIQILKKSSQIIIQNNLLVNNQNNKNTQQQQSLLIIKQLIPSQQQLIIINCEQKYESKQSVKQEQSNPQNSENLMIEVYHSAITKLNSEIQNIQNHQNIQDHKNEVSNNCNDDVVISNNQKQFVSEVISLESNDKYDHDNHTEKLGSPIISEQSNDKIKPSSSKVTLKDLCIENHVKPPPMKLKVQFEEMASSRISSQALLELQANEAILLKQQIKIENDSLQNITNHLKKHSKTKSSIHIQRFPTESPPQLTTLDNQNSSTPKFSKLLQRFAFKTPPAQLISTKYPSLKIYQIPQKIKFFPKTKLSYPSPPIQH